MSELGRPRVCCHIYMINRCKRILTVLYDMLSHCWCFDWRRNSDLTYHFQNNVYKLEMYIGIKQTKLSFQQCPVRGIHIHHDLLSFGHLEQLFTNQFIWSHWSFQIWFKSISLPSSAIFSELQTTSPWPRCRCGCPEIQIWTPSEYFAENLHTAIEKQDLASVSKIQFIHLHLCSRVEDFQVGADIVHPVHLISKWASLLTRFLPD